MFSPSASILFSLLKIRVCPSTKNLSMFSEFFQEFKRVIIYAKLFVYFECITYRIVRVVEVEMNVSFLMSYQLMIKRGNC